MTNIARNSYTEIGNQIRNDFAQERNNIPREVSPEEYANLSMLDRASLERIARNHYAPQGPRSNHPVMNGGYEVEPNTLPAHAYGDERFGRRALHLLNNPETAQTPEDRNLLLMLQQEFTERDPENPVTNRTIPAVDLQR